jgi:hypothetical protein
MQGKQKDLKAEQDALQDEPRPLEVKNEPEEDEKD